MAKDVANYLEWYALFKLPSREAMTKQVRAKKGRLHLRSPSPALDALPDCR
jgi:hypothetical protein